MASATTAKKISPSGTKRKADSKEGHVKGAKKSKVDGAAKPEKKSSKTEEKPEKKAKKPKKVESNDDDSDDMDVDGGVPLKETEDTPMEDAQDGIHPDRRQFAAGQGPNGMQMQSHGYFISNNLQELRQKRHTQNKDKQSLRERLQSHSLIHLLAQRRSGRD